MIGAFGDSVIKGYGVLGNSFVNIDGIKNFGVNGITSKNLLEIVQNSNLNNGIIFIGINDFLNGESVDSTIKNLDDIISVFKSRNGKLILCIPYKLSDEIYGFPISGVNKKIKLFRESILKINDNQVRILDFYKILGEIKDYESLFFDGIHPNTNTHQLMKICLLEVLWTDWLKSIEV